ncbi:hypothetical protein HGRIS_004894 [Hohenbuehelia grisea]|uniref:Uncharacterized protein n=1 Tax=Hohenbuehelia grisea TaxID=104357 RepID=A0ABR3JDY8_9AGAR
MSNLRPSDLLHTGIYGVAPRAVQTALCGGDAPQSSRASPPELASCIFNRIDRCLVGGVSVAVGSNPAGILKTEKGSRTGQSASVHFPNGEVTNSRAAAAPVAPAKGSSPAPTVNASSTAKQSSANAPSGIEAKVAIEPDACTLDRLDPVYNHTRDHP